jgi:hypothetical protein
LTASADRRPVDPPPVVQLHIFDCDPKDDRRGTDITFGYNANFVLYASLEHERVIAQARGTAPRPTPVLTGVPVAGVAYLDRPEQAGYFIFPDLSVRHEGEYRLNFHLYEEVKNPKDADKDAPMPLPNSISNSAAPSPRPPQTYLHFRLDIKSRAFSVYSAKRFPGLAQSTHLSRTIAEQGCRVRIRRDIRMRRRGEKQLDDYEMGDETMFARSDKYGTPDVYVATPIERPRSTSTSTMDRPFADAQRRPSIPDNGVQYAQPYPRRVAPAPPAPWAQAPPYQSHLAFGVTQFQGPQLPPTPPPAAPAVSYSPQAPYCHPRHPSNGSEYGYASNYAHPQPPVPAEPRECVKAPELPRLLQPPKPMNAQPYNDNRSPDHNSYSTGSPAAMSRAQSPMPMNMLPPIKLPETIDSTPPSSSSVASSPAYDMAPRSRFYDPGSSTASKRSHEETFGPDNRPLFNGNRPDTETYPEAPRKPFESPYLSLAEMGEYRRANGSTRMRVMKGGVLQ